ncbi:MAG: hypothetical protein DRP52_01675 [Planctomycetota bacterium]|nr:MAG: hypothetical protein DRP52_01675 [Planctomycetota bacterium]
MATAVETILLKILGDSKSAQQAIKKVDMGLLAFGSTLTAVSTTALLSFRKMGEEGASLEVLEGKFDRMARAFGRSASDMLSEWSKAAAGTLDNAKLIKQANYLALTGIPVDEMTWMLEAVQNAAAATGKPFDELFEKLSTGLVRSSKLLVDDLGIIVDQKQANLAYADSIGKAVEQLTDQDKSLAFTAAARAGAANQEKVFGKAVETSATQIARGKAAVTNFSNEVKKLFVPVAVAASKAITFLTGLFMAIPAPVRQFIANLLALAAAMGAIVGPLLVLKAIWPVLQTAWAAFSATAAGLSASILPIVAAILAVIAVVYILKKAWEENWGGIQQTIKAVIAVIKPILDQIISDIMFWVNAIKQEFQGIMDAVKNIVEPALERFRDVFFRGGAGLADFLRFIKDVSNVIFGTIKALLESIRLLLEGKSDEAFEPLKDAALNVATLIVLGWRKYISKAVTWGWNLIVSFANGVIKAARTVLAAAATFVGNILASFFKAASPPKKGPLSGIVKWGKGLMDTYLKAFGLADFGILKDVLAPMRQALDAAVSFGDIDQKDMLKIFGEVRAQTAALIAGFRQTGEISEEALTGIAEKLGEGGEEYTKYLRLTLEHQKAMQRLKDVQSEVADAEAAGFIPAELKEKLNAAEAEADAAQDAADWQREYLDALQDGVDLQREMIDAMKELAETMKDVAGAGGDVAVADGLDFGAPDIGDGAGLDFAGFGGFSEEFESTKAEIATFFEELPRKAAEMWDQIKLWTAQKGLELITLVGNLWNQIKLIFAQTGLNIITGLLTWWANVKLSFATTGLELIENTTNLWTQIKSIFAQVGLNIITALLTWWASVKLSFATTSLELIENTANLWDRIKLIFAQTGLNIITALLTWWRNIKLAFAQSALEILGDMLTWWDTLQADVITKTEEILTAISDWWDNLILTFATKGLEIITAMLTLWDTIKLDVSTKLSEILLTITNKIDEFKTSGANLIGGFFDGLKEKWAGVASWFSTKMQSLKDAASNIFGEHSHSTVFAQTGRNIFGGLLDGLEDSLPPIQDFLTKNLGNLQGLIGGGVGAGTRGLAAAGAGVAPQITVLQIQGGIELPGVRDGRDAGSIVAALQQAADNAKAKSFVPGGLT